MFKAIRCRLKGHIFTDSHSEPGVQVCLRCRERQPFEGLVEPSTVGPAPLPRGTPGR